MKLIFISSVVRTLLLLVIVVPMNVATAGNPYVPDVLRTRLDEVEKLFAERHRLVEHEGEVLREMNTTTDHELEYRLRSQHQQVLQKITKTDKARLRTLSEVVDLLSGYDGPAARRDWEAVTHETTRLIELLRMERHMILSDPGTPDELVSERGIDKLLEGAVHHLRILYSYEKKFAPEKSQYESDTVTGKEIEGSEKHEATPRKKQDGFMAWFDGQEATVKATLIAAIVSIIGTLATVVVAAIRRHD